MVGAYGQLFRDAPGLGLLSVVAFAGRCPSGMMGIALVVLVERRTGSYGLAGAAAGLYYGGVAVAGLLYGALIARYGYRIVLQLGGVVSAASIAAIPLVAGSRSAAFVLIVAAVGGVTFPPLAACIRSQWTQAHSDPVLLARAATFESVVGEVAFLVGPLLVSAALLAGGPAAPFGVAATLIGGGATVFGRLARAPQPPGDRGRRERHWLRHPRFAAVLGAGLLWCVSFGILSVSVIAASSHAGSPATGGLLIAALSAGAIVGGLALGACDWRAGTAGAAVAVLAIDGLLILPLAAVGENLGLLAAMLVLTGSTRALVLAALNLRVVHSVPAHAEVEAYAWLIAATVAGLAIGPAVGGQLIDAAGISTGFLAAAAAALVGAAALLVDVTDAPTAPATPT